MDVVLRHPYNIEPYDGTVCEEVSLTKQSEAGDADINVILSRYEKTGIVPVDTREKLFIDVSQMENYQAVLEHVRTTEEFFMQLPAGVRSRFENSPSVFLDRVVDPAYRKELQEIGLLEADPPAEAPAAPAGEPAK